MRRGRRLAKPGNLLNLTVGWPRFVQSVQTADRSAVSTLHNLAHSTPPGPPLVCLAFLPHSPCLLLLPPPPLLPLLLLLLLLPSTTTTTTTTATTTTTTEHHHHGTSSAIPRAAVLVCANQAPTKDHQTSINYKPSHLAGFVKGIFGEVLCFVIPPRCLFVHSRSYRLKHSLTGIKIT